MGVGVQFLYFDFRAEETLRQRSNLARLLDRLSESFRVTTKWPAFEYGRAWATFQNHNNVTISAGVDYDDPKRLYVAIGGQDVLYDHPSAAENIESLLYTCELIYQVLHPDYGYGLTSPNLHPIPPSDAAIRALYNYNYFGPALVERIGREALLDIPAMRRTDYDDGGMMLEMSPVMGGRKYRPVFQEAATVLGVENFYQPY